MLDWRRSRATAPDVTYCALGPVLYTAEWGMQNEPAVILSAASNSDVLDPTG